LKASEMAVARRAVTSTAIEIPGNAGPLQGALDEAGREAAAVAVICHPHPLQLGTMQNKVVTTLARTFANLGAVAVRFNFRGVGASAGSYADGEGERDDVLAVVDWSRTRWPGLRVYLGGFSFGAAMALGAAARAAPTGLVTVAPPVTRFATNFQPPQCPWLLIHGSADDVVPAAPVVDWARALEPPPHIVVVEGVGHYFHGHLNVLGNAVVEFFGADFGQRA
jgi:alpha/beta superfamily hydrolase